MPRVHAPRRVAYKPVETACRDRVSLFKAVPTIVPAVQPLRRRPSVRGHGGPSIERRPAWHRIRSVALPRPSPSAADALRVSAAAAAAAEAVAYADNVVLNVPTPSWYLENATEEPNVVVVC
ncbi:hypothetical protein PCL_11492 [Purpureocillium lilacinum]|uniref:Uncharacterized protein n=1 Tax=Purpureocillium lilacinum TaxID=33203 RepID=A0A2U3EA68_PURLI|nr:hypothetical protein Purlil1_2751 [Purpureocillium lilacinum]PWI71398.1 hypothetical protein PCL_11492 [Purpureocillium lilacinum]